MSRTDPIGSGAEISFRWHPIPGTDLRLRLLPPLAQSESAPSRLGAAELVAAATLASPWSRNRAEIDPVDPATVPGRRLRMTTLMESKQRWKLLGVAVA
ncbi:MAG: hypothetical protein ACYCZN_04185 [Candidatus Dormibacteria bacterium]